MQFDRLAYFKEHHSLTRWNLQEPEDALKLYDALRTLESRYFTVYQLEYRAHHYKKTTSAFMAYFVLGKVMNILFPWKDGGGCDVSTILNQLNRRITKLEQELGYAGTQE